MNDFNLRVGDRYPLTAEEIARLDAILLDGTNYEDYATVLAKLADEVQNIVADRILSRIP